ncbi:MAG TPA: circularly permuted type 2 ATP-grasp protein, partial [Candidatus Saccharimonadales bacterium]|nr:circularly permuted type 2 ATP-grasp protein [Candidatus Saccharimonadales bacterium]
MTGDTMHTHDELFASYQPVPDLYDEMSIGAGSLRPHWNKFVQMAAKLGKAEFASRSEVARHNLKDNGVTYNVYGDPQGMDRPWEFDLLPLLISASEWKRIEEGLIQRATLLNKILVDLHGPRTLLREAGLPPSLLFGNPGFLRPCAGFEVPNNTYLHLLAVDLARAADGKWWVLADRTQSPSGSGYALENRIIASRALPTEFRDCQ